ncbi:MAG: Flp family type IVb pilin [Sphingomonas sp.]
MISFLKRLKLLAKHKRGATAIEDGLIAGLIAVAAVGAMSNLGGQLRKTFNNTQTQMSKG